MRCLDPTALEGEAPAALRSSAWEELVQGCCAGSTVEDVEAPLGSRPLAWRSYRGGLAVAAAACRRAAASRDAFGPRGGGLAAAAAAAGEALDRCGARAAAAEAVVDGYAYVSRKGRAGGAADFRPHDERCGALLRDLARDCEFAGSHEDDAASLRRERPGRSGRGAGRGARPLAAGGGRGDRSESPRGERPSRARAGGRRRHVLASRDRRRGARARREPRRAQGRTRVIHRRFNVGVLEATPERNASTLGGRPER